MLSDRFYVGLRLKRTELQEQFYITSGSLDASEPQVVSILLGTDYLGYALYNPSRNLLTELRWFGTKENRNNRFDTLLHHYPQLKMNPIRVVIGIDNNTNILVPTELYQEEPLASLYLNGADTREILIRESIAAYNISNFYTIRQELQQNLNNNFEAYRLKHLKSVWIENRPAPTDKGLLEIVVFNDSFLLVARKDEKVLLAQTYPYSSPADVLFYALRACKNYNLLQETVLIKLSGLVEEGSSLYKTLYLYFIHIEFQQADWVLPATLEFPASHLFTSLYLLSTCA